MKRYTAKLMFQFRVVVDGDSGKRRLCEERILVVTAPNARQALKVFQRRGQNANCSYQNGDGNPVYFEFLGVRDLLELGPEAEDGEVWYEMKWRERPEERSARFIPPTSELHAIKLEANTKKLKKRKAR